MTHTATLKNSMHITTNKVVTLLCISIEDYNHLQWSFAADWLLDQLNHDTPLVDDIMQHPAFMQWWNLNAFHRNNDWFESIAYAIANKQEPNRMLNDYMYFNSSLRLCDQQFKHAQILFNSYANINWF